jgi:hypothetical protein
LHPEVSHLASFRCSLALLSVEAMDRISGQRVRFQSFDGVSMWSASQLAIDGFLLDRWRWMKVREGKEQNDDSQDWFSSLSD